MIHPFPHSAADWPAQEIHLQTLCRMHGLRLTPQRREIYRALWLTCTHPGAETVWKTVRKTLPRLSLDTVYRTLTGLERAGIVQRVGSSEKARFDADLRPHYHFVCMQCGMVEDVFPLQNQPVPYLPAALEELGEVTHIRLQFHGICRRCQSGKKD